MESLWLVFYILICFSHFQVHTVLLGKLNSFFITSCFIYFRGKKETFGQFDFGNSVHYSDREQWQESTNRYDYSKQTVWWDWNVRCHRLRQTNFQPKSSEATPHTHSHGTLHRYVCSQLHAWRTKMSKQKQFALCTRTRVWLLIFNTLH